MQRISMRVLLVLSFEQIVHFWEKNNRRASNPLKMTKFARHMLQKIQDVFFLRVPNRRRQLPPVAQLGGSAHAIVTSYKYTDTLQVYSTQNTSPDTQIQVQTPKYKSKHSKIKSRHPKHKSRHPKYTF